jgi:peptide/nickel transport system permease protein
MDHRTLDVAKPVDVHPERAWLRIARGMTGNGLALAGVATFAFLCAAALLAPWISPQDPYDLGALSLIDSRLAPGDRGHAGGLYLLGTDNQGRDMLSAILYGLRTSLMVGLNSCTAALLLGTAVGLVAGYYGGWMDALIMRAVDLQLSIPSILIALILLAVLGRGADKIILALVAVQWVYFARTVRGSTLVEKAREYVLAGRLFGYGTGRILFVHILPNVLAPVTVVATIEFAHAISLEATLSFLGVGLPITEPSLGLLIANGFSYLLNGEYWISIYPGIALLVTVFSLNLMADQLRDSLDPRLQR